MKFTDLLGKSPLFFDGGMGAMLQSTGLLGLSVLMSTAVPSMQRTIELIKQKLPLCKIVCGGAALTADHAKEMGADYCAKDAMALKNQIS